MLKIRNKYFFNKESASQLHHSGNIGEYWKETDLDYDYISLDWVGAYLDHERAFTYSLYYKNYIDSTDKVQKHSSIISIADNLRNLIWTEICKTEAFVSNLTKKEPIEYFNKNIAELINDFESAYLENMSLQTAVFINKCIEKNCWKLLYKKQLIRVIEMVLLIYQTDAKIMALDTLIYRISNNFNSDNIASQLHFEESPILDKSNLNKTSQQFKGSYAIFWQYLHDDLWPEIKVELEEQYLSDNAKSKYVLQRFKERFPAAPKYPGIDAIRYQLGFK